MIILCDFDGTAAKNDVGYLLFQTFADDRRLDIVQAWKEDKISSKECWGELCRITRVTRTQLERLCDQQQLDPYFIEFVNFCQSKNYEIEIVSDGSDYYVNKILANHGLGSMVTHTNKLEFINPDRIRVTFPFFDFGCGQCGNCKGYHVRNAKTKHDKVIYVGDGYSDRCGAKDADIVFAKRERDLERVCLERRTPYYGFQDFGDVLNQMKRSLSI